MTWVVIIGPRHEKKHVKHVFGVSDKVRFKPVSSATETGKKIEISLVASLDIILSRKRITKELVSLCGCAGWSALVLFANPEDRFSCVEDQLIVICIKMIPKNAIASLYGVHDLMVKLPRTCAYVHCKKS